MDLSNLIKRRKDIFFLSRHKHICIGICLHIEGLSSETHHYKYARGQKNVDLISFFSLIFVLWHVVFMILKGCKTKISLSF
jgi:hypothetical protein